MFSKGRCRANKPSKGVSEARAANARPAQEERPGFQDAEPLIEDASLDSACNMMRGHVSELEREISELYGIRLSVIAEPDRLTQETSELDKTRRLPRL